MSRLVDIRQKYQKLLDCLASVLDEIQVYRLTTPDLDVERFYDLYLLVGKLRSGEWIGISTEVNVKYNPYFGGKGDVYKSTLIPGKAIAKISPEIESLVRIVDRTIGDFTFPPLTPFISSCEIERPNTLFISFIYEIAKTQSQVIDRLLESINLMQIMSAKEIKCEYRLTNTNKCELHNFDEKSRLAAELLDIFQTEFIHHQVYRFGLCSKELYFAGMGADGDTICCRLPFWLVSYE